jgi:hypothetical protein
MKSSIPENLDRAATSWSDIRNVFEKGPERMIRHKRIFGIFTAVILSANIGFAQDIIENPAKPLAANADRKVELKEVLRITDESGKFYFKYPYGIAVGPDGSIFVVEQRELLQFDQAGTFTLDYFKFGQGPGEVQFVAGFVPTGQGLLVHGTPHKLLRFDTAGSFLKEDPLRAPYSRLSLAALQDGVFYFEAVEPPFDILKDSGPDIIDLRHYIYAWKEGREQLDKRGEFSIETSAFRASVGGIAMTPMCRFLVAPIGSSRLIVSHTPDYLLKIFDPESGSVAKSFRRPYKRVRYVPPDRPKGGINLGEDRGISDPRKYAADIANLFFVGGQIWAVTSTTDKAQNPLIDVFDPDGRYLDRFYLTRPAKAVRLPELPGHTVIRDGYLYVLERDEDGISAVVKYEIIDPGSAVR